jgi:hypothetical protein
MGTRTVVTVAPDAHDDAFNIFEDGASGLNNPSKIPTPLVFNVLANDTDADNDALVVTGFDGGPSHGTATISADGHNVIYTPNLDYSGPDSFEYCISDGHGGQDHAVVNVNVAAVADAPTLTYQVHAGATVDAEELSTYMRASLAPHKTPKHWFVVETFPLTGSGKIQKFKLREIWAKGELQAL